MVHDTNTERRVTEAQLERLANWSMRKPVIALMGEFSSGKSTLMNLLIGQNILPTQVTATRMPPVWLTYGDEAPYRRDHDGCKHRVDLTKTDKIPVRTTSYIRLFVKADILKSCDLIDTPGISDPNIKTSYWLRTIRYANAVMWCTHAGQAWRESERGMWETLPPRLRETSILLVTRKDKITSDIDLRKIQRRLERETQNLFNSRMFVSLTNAIKAREKGDANAWTQSGAESFADMLEKIVEGIYVQRSFMLARYTTSYGTNARPASSAGPVAETSNMLGFVDKAGHEPAQNESPKGFDSVFSLAGHEVDSDQPQPTVNEAPDLVLKSYPSTSHVDTYRLSDPSAYRDKQVSRVELSNYRLRDHSDQDTEEAAEVAETETSDTFKEIDLIQKIWADVQANHDVSKTPNLVSAVGQLLENLKQETRSDAPEMKTA